MVNKAGQVPTLDFQFGSRGWWVEKGKPRVDRQKVWKKMKLSSPVSGLRLIGPTCWLQKSHWWMPLSHPGQNFHVSLWRWGSKDLCGQRSGVHYTSTRSWPHSACRAAEDKNSQSCGDHFHSRAPNKWRASENTWVAWNDWIEENYFQLQQKRYI